MPADTQEFPRPRSLSPQLLKDVWAASRDAGKKPAAPGIDGLRARQFGNNLEQNLSRIAKQLQLGEYHFSRLRPVPVPKSNDQFRLICVPTVADRLVQRAIRYRLEQNDRLGVVTGVNYGFIRGQGGVKAALDEAIRRRTRNEWVLKTDIQSFFDRIERPRLKQAVKSKLRSNSLVPLLWRVIDCEAASREFKRFGIRAGYGLRQGMPLSPLLSNFVLSDFDRKVSRAGIDLLRYADDLIVFGPSRKALETALEMIAEELGKLGHEIPPPGKDSKTQLVPPQQPVEFLGLEICYKDTAGRYVARIPKRSKKRILARISEEFSGENALREFPDFRSFCVRLAGVPMAYRGAFGEAEDWERFEPELRGACDAVLAGVFATIFGGAAVRSLDKQKKKFLGLSGLDYD